MPLPSCPCLVVLEEVCDIQKDVFVVVPPSGLASRKRSSPSERTPLMPCSGWPGNGMAMPDAGFAHP